MEQDSAGIIERLHDSDLVHELLAIGVDVLGKEHIHTIWIRFWGVEIQVKFQLMYHAPAFLFGHDGGTCWQW
jgi:hypothetical protein